MIEKIRYVLIFFSIVIPISFYVAIWIQKKHDESYTQKRELKMKMFVFQYLEQVSENFHAGGGLIVIAKDEEHVKELILNEEFIEIKDAEWKDVVVYELKNEEKPRIFVFPDAGCC